MAVPDLTWRDLAALWGAGLSTVLALGRFLPARPHFHLEPGEPPVADLTLRVVNRGESPCLVRELTRCHLSGQEKALGIYTGSSRLDEIGEPGKLRIFVDARGEKRVFINCIAGNRTDGNNRWLIVFTWRGGWALPIAFPVFVYISTSRAARLNGAL